MELEALITEGLINTEALIIDNSEQLGLTVEQLGFLLLFYRYTRKTGWLLPSLQYFAKIYQLDLSDVKRLQNTLFQNGYCEIETRTDNATLVEYVNWSLLYKRLTGKGVKTASPKELTLKVEVVQLIEREFGRMLSPIEIELAGIWSQSYPFDDVVDALKEAILSDVKNMKYIDKILQNWAQGGRRNKPAGIVVQNVEEIPLDDYYNWLETGNEK